MRPTPTAGRSRPWSRIFRAVTFVMKALSLYSSHEGAHRHGQKVPMLTRRVEPTIEAAPWLRRFPVRTPTLPPATHTNVYLAGEERLAVIDVASPYPEEQAALDAALEGLPVAEILLTHHHVDHVSGAAHLAARLGVP